MMERLTQPDGDVRDGRLTIDGDGAGGARDSHQSDGVKTRLGRKRESSRQRLKVHTGRRQTLKCRGRTKQLMINR